MPAWIIRRLPPVSHTSIVWLGCYRSTLKEVGLGYALNHKLLIVPEFLYSHDIAIRRNCTPLGLKLTPLDLVLTIFLIDCKAFAFVLPVDSTSPRVVRLDPSPADNDYLLPDLNII